MKITKITSANLGNAIKYLPKEKAQEVLRKVREEECYTIINRGILWYETLTATQKADLLNWYNAWKDVTETFVIPTKPYWVK
jgi:hypothetical protein